MAYTLVQMRGLVRDRCGLDSTDATATDSIVNSLVNTALRHVAAEFSWDFHKPFEDLAFAAGTASVAPNASAPTSPMNTSAG